MELFEFGSSIFAKILLYVGFMMPSVHYILDIINIRGIVSTGLYVSIGWLMILNLLITPAVIACYRQNHYVLQKIKALSLICGIEYFSALT